MEKPFYILKTSEIFPYDAEQVDSKNVQKNIKETLRPEFFCGNFDPSNPLKADTIKDYQLPHKDTSRFLSR
jgi:hypothetical protein